MRGMLPRQATLTFLVLSLLSGLWACSPSEAPLPTPTRFPPTRPSTPAPTRTPTEIPPTPTATALTCLSADGELVHGEVATDERPIAIIVYLPPCYDDFPETRYPVLYLLNGQPFLKDPNPPGEQWIRIGATDAADALIHSGEAAPFIIVFPEDRYWNIQQGARFGQYFLADVIPHIDANFRTVADREHRALGGLSRGGGWAFQIGLTRPELFGSLGLHSPAILSSDRAALERWMREMPSDLWPRIYFDVGDNDLERDFNIHIEELLTHYAVPHEWHLNNGAHDEIYWSAHVDEYIRWYAEGWALP